MLWKRKWWAYRLKSAISNVEKKEEAKKKHEVKVIQEEMF